LIPIDVRFPKRGSTSIVKRAIGSSLFNVWNSDPKKNSGSSNKKQAPGHTSWLKLRND